MYRALVFLGLFYIMTFVHAQFPFSVKEYTDSLATLGAEIVDGKSDFSRFEANEKFKALLLFILSHENAYEIDFSTVRNLSVLKPDKDKLKIFTWVVPRTNLAYECFGIVYAWNERKRNYQITELKDIKGTTQVSEKALYRKGEWWGALYYEIIPVKSRGRQYFTLLGWDGNNALTSRKVIDVLSLSPMGQPTFGATLFRGYGKQARRIIFEYSDNTQMALRYERQAYIVEKQKSKRKKSKPVNPNARTQITSDGFRAQKKEDDNVRRKRKSDMMIVFDHLAPLNPSLAGVYEFYVPSNVVDGFIYFNDRWNYIHDVEARNASSPVDKVPQSVTENGVRVSQRKVKSKIPVIKEE
jgi:hypothetical protein